MLAPQLKETIGTLLGMGAKTGDVGIELETEGERLPTAVVGWTVKAEGSLRGRQGRLVSSDDTADDTPREYVSRRPFPLDTVRARVQTLQDAFKAVKSTVNITPRASTHIHVNMTQESASSFLAFLLVFVCVEPVLLRLCGPGRNGNLFCIPTFETWDLPDYAKNLARVLSSPALSYSWPTRGKYGSINPDPITTLGSVEVRCFPNTFDPDTIQRYAEWMVNIRSLASSMEPPFDRELTRFWREPMTLLHSVFGNTPLATACLPQNPSSLVLFGLEQAHEIRENFEPLFDWKPKKENTEDKGFVNSRSVRAFVDAQMAMPEPMPRTTGEFD